MLVSAVPIQSSLPSPKLLTQRFFAGYGKRIINWYANSSVNRSIAFIWRLKKYWWGKFVIMWLFVWTLTNTWIRKAGSLGKIISFISQPHSLKICRSNVFIYLTWYALSNFPYKLDKILFPTVDPTVLIHYTVHWTHTYIGRLPIYLSNVMFVQMDNFFGKCTCVLQNVFHNLELFKIHFSQLKLIL